MAVLPDENMKGVAQKVIELLGNATDFERRDSGGAWNPSAAGIKVHTLSSGNPTSREAQGVSALEKYACLAPSGTDIKKGDRCVMGGVYCSVISLRDVGTHLEFELMETSKKPGA